MRRPRLSLEALEPRRVLDAGPLISEVMSDNADTLLDGDGAYSDWIELFNPTSAAVDLNGWYLTDDAEEPAKWPFPNVTLDSGGYLVVIASGQNRDDYVDPLGYPHTNFRLDADGEYVALVRPDGQTIQHQFAPLPRQLTDTPYGLPQNVTSLVPTGAGARVLVPTDDSADAEWTNVGFDDSAWTAAATGIGFELEQGQGRAIAYANNPGNVGTQTYGGSLGHDFDVLAPITVTRLGVFDSGSDGLARTLTAQLWSRSGNTGQRLAELVFTSASPGELVGGDRFKALPQPLELSPGAYTIVAYGYGSGEPNGNEGTGGPVAASKSMNDGGDVLALVGSARYGTAGAFPATVDGGPENRYSAGTFEFRAPAYGNLITTNIADQMHGINASLYSRFEFPVTDPTRFQSLALRIQYDDGFVAYLNGHEIARRNAPDQPAFDSMALMVRPLEESLQVETINVTSALPSIQAGTNVLSIHALNADRSDSDFLLLPELLAVESVDASPVYFQNPTPGGPNDSSLVFAGFVGDLSISVDHGFHDTPFDVQIASSTADAVIRYTLDGSAPTATTGIVYNRPLTIRSQTVLRAAAFKDNLRPTDVLTRTYLFLDSVLSQSSAPAGFPSTWNGTGADYAMDQNPAHLAQIAGDPRYTPQQYQPIIKDSLRSLPTLSIVMDQRDLFGPNGIYSNPTQRGAAWQRPASIEYILPDGQEGFQINAGLQILGGTSRNPSLTPKHSLRIVFKKEYGPGRLNYPFFDNSDIDSYNTIALRANARDSWPANSEFAGANSSYLRDEWAKLALAEMGANSTAGDFVHLYINGLYWGLYNPTERPDAAYAEEHLGGDAEEYDVVKFCCPDRVVDGSMEPWDRLLTLAQAGLASDAAYQFVQGNNPDGTRNPNLDVLLDVDNIIDYIINGQYHAATDWPGNYFALRRRGPESEGFQFFTWDNDLAFPYGNVNADKTRSDNNNWWTESPGVIDLALRQNAEYRLRFADRVRQELFHDGSLTPTAAANRWIKLADTIREAMIAESVRWGDSRGGLLTPATWEQVNQQMLTNYFPRRTEIVLAQMRSRGLYPSIDAPEFTINGSQLYGGVISAGDRLGFQTASGEIFYTLDGSDPRLPGGGVHPTSAIRYDGPPLELDQSVQVKARVRSAAGLWSALSDATFAVATPLRITELNYHPYPPTAAELVVNPQFDAEDFEFVELVNTGSAPIDLSGIRFAAGSPIDYEFPTGATAQPGQTIVLARRPDALVARYGPGVQVDGIYTGNLANGGEEVVLLDALGLEIQRFAYDDQGSWPGRADGNGSSLEAIDTSGDFTDSRNWRPSQAYGGTPGVVSGPWQVDVVVNEVLTHTDPPQLDAIELYNTTAQDIDISRWYLSDSNENYLKFQIPAGTILAAGAYVVFDENDFYRSGGASENDFRLDGARGDDVWLLASDSSGRPLRFADRAEFAAAANGQSWGRLPNGTGELVPLRELTLGSANSDPQVGPVVISEVMYHAAPTNDGSDADKLDFIELYNSSAETVIVGGWILDGDVDFKFVPGVQLLPRTTIVVVAFDPTVDSDSLTRFLGRYGDVPLAAIYGGYQGKLDNGGQRLRLMRPDEPPADDPNFVPYLLVDQVTYDDEPPWPVDADGGGASLHRIDENSWGDEVSAWGGNSPTPGATAFFPVVRSVTINTSIDEPADLPAGPQPTNWSMQRSLLHSLRVEFSKSVTVTAGDLRLTNLGLDPSTGIERLVELTADQLSLEGNVLTILLDAPRLEDGVYRLELLPSIVDHLGQPLDGNADGIAGDSFTWSGEDDMLLYQLTGDWNGDGGVTIFDFPTLSYWFGHAIDTAPAYVDLNQDKGITIFDFSVFAANFGASVRVSAGQATGSHVTEDLLPLVVPDFATARRPARHNIDRPVVDANHFQLHDQALLDVLSGWTSCPRKQPRSERCALFTG